MSSNLQFESIDNLHAALQRKITEEVCSQTIPARPENTGRTLPANHCVGFSVYPCFYLNIINYEKREITIYCAAGIQLPDHWDGLFSGEKQQLYPGSGGL